MLRHILLLAALVCSTYAQAALAVTFRIWNEQCSNNNGQVEASASGGQYPYTYSWSNAATSATITGLDAGTYTLTVTDDLGAELVVDAVVIDVPEIQVPDFAWNSQTMGVGEVLVSVAGLHACPGQCNGGYAWSNYTFTPNLVQPLSYFPVQDGGPLENPIFTGYCATDIPNLQITDGSGCTGAFPITGLIEAIAAPMQLVNVEAACGPTGSITVNSGDLSLAYGEMGLYDASFQEIGGPIFLSFGATTHTWEDLPAGEYHVQRILSSTVEDCPTMLDVTVPSAGSPCGSVGGMLFLDHDQDCVQDAGDGPVPFQVLTVQPGGLNTITDVDGTYDLGLPYGSFTVEQTNAGNLYQLCPVGSPVPFVINGTQPDVIVDFADSSLVVLDLETYLGVGPLRPGFAANYWAQVRNLGGQLSGPVPLTVTLDPALIYTSADPVPTTVAGNTLTWTNPPLGAFEVAGVHVVVQVPPTIPIGTILTTTFTASQPLAEPDLANNTSVRISGVTGSYDPNDKVAETSSGTSSTEYIIGTDDYIDYTIRFQNTGTDTAFTVVVTDTLSEAVDMASFQQGAASHAFHVSFKPDRVVEWRFEDILLPDSNVNEVASHGLVNFRIKPVEPLLPGTVIANVGNIYFDFNEPVTTQPSVLMAEFSTSVGHGSSFDSAQDGSPRQLILAPNPASDRLRVSVEKGSIVRMRIIGIDGREVKRFAAQQRSVELDVHDLPAGAYVLEAEMSDTSHRINGRFVKH